MRFGSFEGPYNFSSRFEEGEGTNPEELIGGVFAGCFAIALSHELAQKGYTPEMVDATAGAYLNKVGDGFAIESIDLTVAGKVTGVQEKEFKKMAEVTSQNCLVAKVLAGTKIGLQAKLEN
jgi:osmotically inducible protein OsmC